MFSKLKESESGSGSDLSLDNFNSDCLLLILDRLSVRDVLHLGQTCRTLYSHCKEFSRRTTSLIILKGNQNQLAQYKADFGKVTWHKENELFKEAKQLEFELPLSEFLRIDQIMSLTFPSHRSLNFPNLKYLLLAVTIDIGDLVGLLIQLMTTIGPGVETKLLFAPSHFQRQLYPRADHLYPIWIIFKM